jgi:hypothetical protein
VQRSNIWFALILIASAVLLSGASDGSPLPTPKTEQNESLTEKQTPKAESNQNSASAPVSQIQPEVSRVVGKPSPKKKQDDSDHGRPEASDAELIMVGVNAAYVIVAFFTLVAVKHQADIAEQAITEIERPWIMVLPFSYEIQPSAGTPLAFNVLASLADQCTQG